MSDTDTRMRRLEDRAELRDLVTRYGLAIDDHDFALLRELFANDAVYGRAGEPETHLHGRDQIVAALKAVLGGAGPSFHVAHEQLLQFDANDPDTATGVVTCHAETSHGGQRVAAIRYRDRYLRQDGRWVFAVRQIAFLYFTPLAQYPSILTRPDRIIEAERTRPADWPPYA